MAHNRHSNMIIEDAEEKMVRKTLKVTSSPSAEIEVVLLGINLGVIDQLKQLVPKINRH